MMTQYAEITDDFKNVMQEIAPWMPFGTQGCPYSHIIEMMTAQDVDYLPPLYEDFMLDMGRMGYLIFPMRKYVYPYILNFKKDLLRFIAFWVELGNVFELPKDAFVFVNDFGAGFLYFCTSDKNPDPIVHYIWEDDGIEYMTRSESLLDYFTKLCKVRIEHAERMNKRGQIYIETVESNEVEED